VTHRLENGCPLDVIATVLGHDNLYVTALWAQVSTRLMMKSDKAGAAPHEGSMREMKTLGRRETDARRLFRPCLNVLRFASIDLDLLQDLLAD
jgi:hypothetical protein